MTISKEERVEWQEAAKNTIYVEPVYSAYSKLCNRILLLLDALDSAEARAEQWEADFYKLNDDAFMAETIRIQAERERDLLIEERLMIHKVCPSAEIYHACMSRAGSRNTSMPDCKQPECKQCWLEWAHQQVSEEETCQ